LRRRVASQKSDLGHLFSWGEYGGQLELVKPILEQQGEESLLRTMREEQ
jgi:hypothetical protein